MSSPETQSPINPLPPLIAALFMVLLVIEAAFSLGANGIIGGPGAIGWRLSAAQQYAFIDPTFDWMRINGVYPFEHMIRFVTYPFVHSSFTQALFAGVILLALGKMVGEVFSTLATFAVLVVATITGALAYGLILNTPIPLLGAFPSVYGLIGAFTYLLWLRLGQDGGPQIRAFTLIGFLMGIRVIFGVLFGTGPDWVADLAGFCAGFALSFFVSPGGWRAFRARIRHR